MNTEIDASNGFEFRSNLYKYFLWAALLIVLLIDVVSIPAIFAGRADLPVVMLGMVVAGISIRVGLLIVLLIKKGPIDVLVYAWGGLFILSGSTGLLAFTLTADAEPLTAYLDNGLFLLLGLLLVVPFSKSVAKIEARPRNDQSP